MIDTMQQMQKTLKHKITFSGIGVHSGMPSRVTLWPAGENEGLVFCNAGQIAQKITVGHVVPEEAMHATVIKGDGWAVSTIEHLMAALMVLGVDNAVIEIEGYEVPILDGSALIFVQGILDCGLTEQSVARRLITPRKALSFSDQQGRSVFIDPASNLFPSRLDIEYSADFNHPLAGGRHFKGEVTADFFVEQLAPARTFGFLDQLPFLRQHNLARGSSLSNTVVIAEDVLNDMRFSDECVRHKVLDLIGDLSLLGMQLVGSVRAYKTSHNFNRLVIQHYLQNPAEWINV